MYSSEEVQCLSNIWALNRRAEQTSRYILPTVFLRLIYVILGQQVYICQCFCWSVLIISLIPVVFWYFSVVPIVGSYPCNTFTIPVSLIPVGFWYFSVVAVVGSYPCNTFTIPVSNTSRLLVFFCGSSSWILSL